MEPNGGGVVSAAEKKKLRRKKAKKSKKELKTSQIEVHAALHRAQEAESSKQRARPGTTPREGDALLDASTAAARAHVIEYVPEPLTSLEALSQAVEDAAMEDNPYDGLTGLDISDPGDKKSNLDELQRIAQYFASVEDVPAADDMSAVTEQPLVTTELVKEKEDEKPDPEEGVTLC